MKKIYQLKSVFAFALLFLSSIYTESFGSPEKIFKKGFLKYVTGKVIDEKGVPMIGVSVKLKNSEIGAATNSEGRFTLTVPDDKSILVFSYLGYNTQELRLTNASDYTITMVPAVS